MALNNHRKRNSGVYENPNEDEINGFVKNLKIRLQFQERSQMTVDKNKVCGCSWCICSNDKFSISSSQTNTLLNSLLFYTRFQFGFVQTLFFKC